MKSASYMKEQKLSIPAKRFTLTGIPALKSVQLSFYQKYIILLLQKQVKASSIRDLAEKLSLIMNFSFYCVLEFLEYLQNSGHLEYSSTTGSYSLDKDLHIQIDPMRQNAMFADLDMQEADCDKIIYLEDLESFFLESDFPDGEFKKSELPLNRESAVEVVDVEDALDEKSQDIQNLVTRAFSSSNVHLLPDFTFRLKANSCHDIRIEFDVALQYLYSSETKEAIRKNAIIPDSNPLPRQYIDQLVSKYNIDTKLPRFITLDEAFYQKIVPNVEAIADCEDKVAKQSLERQPLEEEVRRNKTDLAETRKKFKNEKILRESQKKKTSNKILELDKTIEKKRSIIDNIEGEENNDIIDGFRNDINALTIAKEKLAQDIKEKEDDLISIQKEYEKREEELNQTIKEKEDKISEINTQVTTLSKQKNGLEAECKSLISEKRSKLNPIIDNVIAKFPIDKNSFNRNIVSACSSIDSAISASECDAFDDLWIGICAARAPYQIAFKAIFDSVLSEKNKTLGSYLADAYCRVQIENWFRVKRIDLSVFSNFRIFHDVVRAAAHRYDEGEKQEWNRKQIEEFKRMTRVQREKVLLSVPNFFNSVEFSKKEEKAIIEWFRT